MRSIVPILMLLIGCHSNEESIKQESSCDVDSLIMVASQEIKIIKAKKKRERQRLDSLKGELTKHKGNRDEIYKLTLQIKDFEDASNSYEVEILELKTKDTIKKDTIIYNIAYKDSEVILFDTVYDLKTVHKELIVYDTIKLKHKKKK